MTTTGRVRQIAREAIRLGVAPNATPTWRSDGGDFGRRYSAEVWDAIAELRAGGQAGGVDGVARVHLDPRNQTSRYLASQGDSSDQDESACSCGCVECRMGNCSGCTYSADDCPDAENCTHGDDEGLEAEDDECDEDLDDTDDSGEDDLDEREREDEEEDDE